MNDETKICQHTECGKKYTRTISAKGKKEPERFWVKRRFCSSDCANKGRWETHYRNVIEDVEWLVGTDHPHSIAKRVGYKNIADLMHTLRDRGRADLAEKLSADMARYNAPTLTERDIYGRFTGLVA